MQPHDNVNVPHVSVPSSSVGGVGGVSPRSRWECNVCANPAPPPKMLIRHVAVDHGHARDERARAVKIQRRGRGGCGSEPPRCKSLREASAENIRMRRASAGGASRPTRCWATAAGAAALAGMGKDERRTAWVRACDGLRLA